MSDSRKASRHYRAILIDQQDMLDLFSKRSNQFLRDVQFDDIPADAIARHVEYSPAHLGWLIYLEHPSFPEVEPGMQIRPELLKYQKRIVEMPNV